jgi:Zn-dependent protease
MLTLAAAADFRNPLFWAVFIGWVLSVVLHEFAHGVVAYWGGDYTIRERGGLTLNPLQYIDPVGSLLLPILFLLMGGVPLPGGATYVRRDLLRSRACDTMVSLAGPAMNVLLFLACAIPLHPEVGWVETSGDADAWTPAQRLLATLIVLQGVSVVLNLVPVPPLDGFQAIAPYMDEETRTKLMTPPTSTVAMVGFLLFLMIAPGVRQALYTPVFKALSLIGYDGRSLSFVRRAFNMTMFGTDS